eukprot:1152030-Pelagomonas_calceolata.AAC.1
MASKQKYVIHALRYAYPSSLACMDAAGSSEGEHVPKCEAVGGGSDLPPGLVLTLEGAGRNAAGDHLMPTTCWPPVASAHSAASGPALLMLVLPAGATAGLPDPRRSSRAASRWGRGSKPTRSSARSASGPRLSTACGVEGTASVSVPVCVRCCQSTKAAACARFVLLSGSKAGKLNCFWRPPGRRRAEGDLVILFCLFKSPSMDHTSRNQSIKVQPQPD